MNNNKFSLKYLKLNIILVNNFINNNNITLLIFFKKFIFDLIFDYKIYNIEKT